MTRDESIAEVPEPARNEVEEHHPRPRRTEASEDLEDGVRFRVGGVIHDQNHAGQLGGAAHPLFHDRVTGGRLLCSEAKKPGGIATDDESHPAIAEITDSIE